LQIKISGRPYRKMKNDLERGILDEVGRIGWKKEERGLRND
jgi:hypothetical protein